MKKLGSVFILSIAAAVFIGFGAMKSSASRLPQDQKTRIIPLPELEEPGQICVENGRVYIRDKRDIVVYDFMDGRFRTRIGKPGQGPGEFTWPSRLTVSSDRLVISDMRKIKFFSFDGKYSSEIKEPGSMGFYPFLPVGNNFVGFPMERQADGSYAPPVGCIYDQDLKLKKKFYSELPSSPPPPPPPGSQPPAVKTDVMMILDYVDYLVSDDKIYVADSRKGLSISVFDKNGDLLYEIRHPVEKIKVPQNYLDAVIKEQKASKYWALISAHQNRIFPEYFPDFVGFKIDGGRIYVITPAQKDGLYEVMVMDLQGRILEKSFRFPLKPNFQVPQAFSLSYDVEGNKFVWVAYNEAKEIYELHIR